MSAEFPFKMVNDDFFEIGPEGPFVAGSKCHKCGRVYFPKKNVCVDCWEWGNMEVIPLSRRGRLTLYTVATMSMLGLDTPYACGYVDLPEGVRLYTLLTDCEPFEEKLKSDMEMEWVIEKMLTNEFGEDVYTYKFRPVKE